MNENDKLGCLYSWPVIILALFVFWPIGIYLIIKRVSVNKKTAISGAESINTLGWVVYTFAVLNVFLFISNQAPIPLCMALFFGIAGFVCHKIAKKTKTEADETKKYLSVIVNGNERQIDAIASSMGKSYDVVKNDIQNLIDKGYLKNAYINEGSREVVLSNDNIQEQAEIAAANNITSKIVACHCCGANNTIMGDMGECEYCGSPLK